MIYQSSFFHKWKFYINLVKFRPLSLVKSFIFAQKKEPRSLSARLPVHTDLLFSSGNFGYSALSNVPSANAFS